MQADGFFDVVQRRRSVRRFKPDPVPDEDIKQMLNAARSAMSGANAQPWEFIVIKEQTTRNKIVEQYMHQLEETWEIEKTRVKELRHPRFVDGPGIPSFKNAPVFIIVCGDPRTVQASVLVVHFLGYEGNPGAHFAKAMANATQLLHLSAAALGLASQWVSVGHTLEESLKTLLGVPEELTIPTIVPVGYPAYEAPPAYRREFEEIVHFEKYDQSKFRSGGKIFDFLLSLRQHTVPSYSPSLPKAGEAGNPQKPSPAP